MLHSTKIQGFTKERPSQFWPFDFSRSYCFLFCFPLIRNRSPLWEALGDIRERRGAVDLFESCGPSVDVSTSPLPSPVATSLEFRRQLITLRVTRNTTILASPSLTRSIVLRGTSIQTTNTTPGSVDIEINIRNTTSIDGLDDHTLARSGARSPCELVALAARVDSSISVSRETVRKCVVDDLGLEGGARVCCAALAGARCAVACEVVVAGVAGSGEGSAGDVGDPAAGGFAAIPGCGCGTSSLGTGKAY